MNQPNATISQQQIDYFNTFGFIKLKDLFKADVQQLEAGFENAFRVVGEKVLESHESVHGNQRRLIIPGFLRHDEYLSSLLDDPRIVDIAHALVGEDYRYAESDGNLFFCDSHWHADIYAAPMAIYHIKISFYLESLTEDTGAIRFIPGSNYYRGDYAKKLRKALKNPQENFEIEGQQVPCYVMPTDPGDLVIWNFRTIHASYNGKDRRRLFSINFSGHTDA